MKYIKQFLIILAISFAGEILSHLIPFPIPGSIYGIVILFTGLVTFATTIGVMVVSGRVTQVVARKEVQEK